MGPRRLRRELVSTPGKQVPVSCHSLCSHSIQRLIWLGRYALGGGGSGWPKGGPVNTLRNFSEQQMLDCVPAHQPQADAFYNVGFMSLEGESRPQQPFRALSLSLSPLPLSFYRSPALSVSLVCCLPLSTLAYVRPVCSDYPINHTNHGRPHFSPYAPRAVFLLPLISPYRNEKCLWRRCKLNISKIIPNSKFSNRTQVSLCLSVSLSLCLY